MSLLTVLVTIFSKELRDSYLTTVVEQEINNTVLINHELSRRCIWIQTGALPSKTLENGTAVDNEMNRRLNNIHSELKVVHRMIRCFALTKLITLPTTEPTDGQEFNSYSTDHSVPCGSVSRSFRHTHCQ